MDVSLDTTAVEVGVAAPHRATSLVTSASIVYSDMDKAVTCGEAVNDARQNSDSTIRAALLSQSLMLGESLKLQATRIEHLRELAQRGHDSEDIWKAIGTDVVVRQPSCAGLKFR